MTTKHKSNCRTRLLRRAAPRARKPRPPFAAFQQLVQVMGETFPHPRAADRREFACRLYRCRRDRDFGAHAQIEDLASQLEGGGLRIGEWPAEAELAHALVQPAL